MKLAQVTTVPADFIPTTDWYGWWNYYDPHGYIALVVITLITVFIAYKLLKRMPLAWGYSKSTYSSWREDRDVRRARTKVQHDMFCAKLEEGIDKMLSDGDMDPKTAQRWRRKFSAIIPDMKPRKADVKNGIRLRFRMGWYEDRSPLPEPTRKFGK